MHISRKRIDAAALEKLRAAWDSAPRQGLTRMLETASTLGLSDVQVLDLFSEKGGLCATLRLDTEAQALLGAMRQQLGRGATLGWSTSEIPETQPLEQKLGELAALRLLNVGSWSPAKVCEALAKGERVELRARSLDSRQKFTSESTVTLSTLHELALLERQRGSDIDSVRAALEKAGQTVETDPLLTTLWSDDDWQSVRTALLMVANDISEASPTLMSEFLQPAVKTPAEPRLLDRLRAGLGVARVKGSDLATLIGLLNRPLLGEVPQLAAQLALVRWADRANGALDAAAHLHIEALRQALARQPPAIMKQLAKVLQSFEVRSRSEELFAP